MRATPDAHRPAQRTRLNVAIRVLAALLLLELAVVLLANAYSGFDAIAALLDSVERQLHRANAVYESIFGEVAGFVFSFLDVYVLIGFLLLFVRTVPQGAEPPRRPSRHLTLRQRFFQTRIRSLLVLTTFAAVVCGTSRGMDVNPLLILFGLLYICGPWTALLAGHLVRAWQPARERDAATATLAALASLAVAYVITAALLDSRYTIGIRDLVELTAWLWCPQVLLYLLLRPLLLPEYAARVTSSFQKH